MAKQRMEVSTSALNLTKSLVDTSIGDTLVEAGKTYYEWLIRERVDKTHFEKCRELAAGLGIYPNEAGCALQSSIDAADRKLLSRFKTTHLPLVISGSVGRLIGRELDTTYMTTTVATLVHHHHPDFATNVFCNMMLDEGGHEDGPQYQYTAVRTPIQTVMSKIVNSIYFNVCNAGQYLSGLPNELRYLHPHTLDERHFASIVMGIQRSTGDVVIQSQHFLADLTLWLYYHFEGVIELAVENTIIFGPVVRGRIKRRITILVDTVCAEPIINCSNVAGHVRASLSVGNDLRAFVKGEDQTDSKVASFVRRSFYDLDQTPIAADAGQRRGELMVLGRADINSINHAAKTIVKWMLNVTVLASAQFDKLDYEVDPQATQSKGMCTLADLFPCLPRVVHLNTGDVSRPGPVFRYTDGQDQWNASHDEVNTSTVVSWFPLLQDIMDALQVRCPCQACGNQDPLFKCKAGCLRQVGMSRFLTLIAHSMTDAMGGADVSGITLAENCVEATMEMFRELVRDHRILWTTVFALSASVTTGLPFRVLKQSVRENSFATEGSSALVAVQCGSFVTMAAWLNLNEECYDYKPFALRCMEGTIKSVPDTTALVTCEASDYGNEKPPLPTYSDETMDSEAPVPRPDPASLMTDLSSADSIDDSDVELMTTIFRSNDQVYRLMTMVRSGKYLRIVDPGVAVRSAFSSCFLQCAHHDGERGDRDTLLARSKVCDFEEIMSYRYQAESDAKIQVTRILEDTVKVNAILSMSPNGCVLRNVEKCCFECAVEAIKRLTPLESDADTCRLIMFRSSDNQVLRGRT